MVDESRMVVGNPSTVAGAANLFAYGDSDDPARLVVLLADRVLAVAPVASDAARNARECLDPRTRWNRRLECLASGLHDVTAQQDQYLVALWDMDALAVDEVESWESEHVSLTRRGLFRVLYEAVSKGGWILVRTALRGHATTAVDELDIARTSVDAEDGVPEQARLYAPECRKIASWLVERGVLRPTDLTEIQRTVTHSDEHIVDLAYESMDPVVRDGAALLSALRAPQQMNGYYGPLPFTSVATQPSSRSLPAAIREPLVASGFLQKVESDGTWRMPRIVRSRLAPIATLVDDEIRELHRHVAETDANDRGPKISVEAHHHAICAGDVALAKRTAYYYGSELCTIATRISREAEAPDDYIVAAELFEHVVRNFDDSDAYAWEYYGYNLARGRAGNMSIPDERAIRDAYHKAHTLRKGRNPLYHGRFLGFIARLGEAVDQRAVAGIREYATYPVDREPVSFFAEAVFSGLFDRYRSKDKGALEQARSILKVCREPLVTLAPRVIESTASWVV